jgi:hypothetical protein
MPGDNRDREQSRKIERSPHSEQRSLEAQKGDIHRQVGDVHRTVREGRRFRDTETDYNLSPNPKRSLSLA